MARCVCFDFDGTLVASMDAAFNAYQRVGPGLGCTPLTREELLAMRGLHVREVIRAMGIPLYRVPLLAQRIRQAMRAELMATPPVEGIAAALDGLCARGHRIGVISSNARDSVAAYAEHQGLRGFSFIIGGAPLFKKASALRALRRRERLAPDQVIYVGDELRDIEAARAAGVIAVAVGWGYNSAERLAAARPDTLLRQPRELLVFAEELGE